MPWLSWWWLGCSAIVYIRQPASFPAQPTKEHLIDPFMWQILHWWFLIPSWTVLTCFLRSDWTNFLSQMRHLSFFIALAIFFGNSLQIFIYAADYSNWSWTKLGLVTLHLQQQQLVFFSATEYFQNKQSTSVNILLLLGSIRSIDSAAEVSSDRLSQCGQNWCFNTKWVFFDLSMVCKILGWCFH